VTLEGIVDHLPVKKVLIAYCLLILFDSTNVSTLFTD